MPDRVGKGMIEAIANPVHWVGQHSHEWMDTWMQDADKAYRWFLNSCAKVNVSSRPNLVISHVVFAGWRSTVRPRSGQHLREGYRAKY